MDRILSRDKTLFFLWISLCLLLIAANIFLILENFHVSGWDFRVYYTAVKTIEKGNNPYFANKLKGYSDKGFTFFPYPPLILIFFKAIISSCPHLDLKISYYIFWSLFLIAAFYVIKKIYSHSNVLLLVTLLLTGFVTTYWNYLTGNIGIIELFVFSLIFYWITRKRYYLAAIFIGLMGFVKILPIAFGSLFLFADTARGNRYKIFLLIPAIFILLHTISYALFPGISSTYFLILSGKIPGQYNPMNEGGLQCNPALFCLINDIACKLFISNRIIFLGMYGLFVSFVFLLFLYYALKKQRGFLEVFCVGVLSFLLIFPRLKPYSFTLALVPIYFLIKEWNLKDLIFPILLISAFPTLSLIINNIYPSILFEYAQSISLLIFYMFFIFYNKNLKMLQWI